VNTELGERYSSPSRSSAVCPKPAVIECVADRARVVDRFGELPVFGEIAVVVVADGRGGAILTECQAAGHQGRRQTQDQDGQDLGKPVHEMRWNSLETRISIPRAAVAYMRDAAGMMRAASCQPARLNSVLARTLPRPVPKS
jgi:hypothetical protein